MIEAFVPLMLLWVPETFHARFPVSAEGRRLVGLRPTKLLVTREKKSLIPRVRWCLHNPKGYASAETHSQIFITWSSGLSVISSLRFMGLGGCSPFYGRYGNVPLYRVRFCPLCPRIVPRKTEVSENFNELWPKLEAFVMGLFGFELVWNQGLAISQTLEVTYSGKLMIEVHRKDYSELNYL